MRKSWAWVLTLGSVWRQQRNIVQLLDGALGCTNTGIVSQVCMDISIGSFYCNSAVAINKVQQIHSVSSFRMALPAVSTYRPGGPWRS